MARRGSLTCKPIRISHFPSHWIVAPENNDGLYLLTILIVPVLIGNRPIMSLSLESMCFIWGFVYSCAAQVRYADNMDMMGMMDKDTMIRGRLVDNALGKSQ